MDEVLLTCTTRFDCILFLLGGGGGESHHTNVSNYQPISLLSLVSKVLERRVHNGYRVMDFLLANKLLSDRQFGASEFEVGIISFFLLGEGGSHMQCTLVSPLSRYTCSLNWN